MVGAAKIMKRVFDLLACILALPLLAAPMLVIVAAIRISSKGPALFWSKRVGKNKILFGMPKFRSMIIGTPHVATHLLHNPNTYLTPIGGFLRRFSLDELPQLYSVIKGEMSLVGPRPALHNQQNLIDLRANRGVDHLIPGITGWAQVNGRDELSIQDKVDLEVEYLHNQTIWFDLKILGLTFLKVVKRDGVSH